MICAAQFIACYLLTVPMMLLGTIAVAIGLPFRRDAVTSECRSIIRLPLWLLPWDNVIDGLAGDKRGTYAAQTAGWNPLFAMWWWAAVRNPANYFKRFMLTCDVTRCRITKLRGQDYVRDDFNSIGFQLLQAEHEFGMKFYHLYFVRRWGESKRAIVVELGFKFRLGDDLEEYSGDAAFSRYKGFTFEVNPFKDIS